MEKERPGEKRKQNAGKQFRPRKKAEKARKKDTPSSYRKERRSWKKGKTKGQAKKGVRRMPRR